MTVIPVEQEQRRLPYPPRMPLLVAVLLSLGTFMVLIFWTGRYETRVAVSAPNSIIGRINRANLIEAAHGRLSNEQSSADLVGRISLIRSSNRSLTVAFSGSTAESATQLGTETIKGLESLLALSNSESSDLTKKVDALRYQREKYLRAINRENSSFSTAIRNVDNDNQRSLIDYDSILESIRYHTDLVLNLIQIDKSIVTLSSEGLHTQNFISAFSPPERYADIKRSILLALAVFLAVAFYGTRRSSSSGVQSVLLDGRSQAATLTVKILSKHWRRIAAASLVIGVLAFSLSYTLDRNYLSKVVLNIPASQAVGIIDSPVIFASMADLNKRLGRTVTETELRRSVAFTPISLMQVQLQAKGRNASEATEILHSALRSFCSYQAAARQDAMLLPLEKEQLLQLRASSSALKFVLEKFHPSHLSQWQQLGTSIAQNISEIEESVSNSGFFADCGPSHSPYIRSIANAYHNSTFIGIAMTLIIAFFVSFSAILYMSERGSE